MFGMGFTEILLILIIAIIFLGPERLPKVAVDVAKFFRSFKSTVDEAKNSLSGEIDDIKETKANLIEDTKVKFETFDDIKKELDSMKGDK
jgi:sec-independent protein translocase protein TatB